MDSFLQNIERCDICDSKCFVVVDQPGNILCCTECGFMFTSPRRSMECELVNYDYFFSQKESDSSVYKGRLKIFSERLKVFRSFCPSGDILDVGAGFGDFLHLCQQTGDYHIKGTEVSKPLIILARELYGLQIDKGFLEEINYPQGSFDAITMWHVLEHVPSPQNMVRQLYRLLKVKGLLFIAVPNESVWGRTQFIINRIKTSVNRMAGRSVCKLKKMFPIYADEGNWHLSHFTPMTLRKLLEKVGFEILEVMPDANWEREHQSAFKNRRCYRMAKIFYPITGVLAFNAMLMVARKT